MLSAEINIQFTTTQNGMPQCICPSEKERSLYFKFIDLTVYTYHTVIVYLTLDVQLPLHVASKEPVNIH